MIAPVYEIDDLQQLREFLLRQPGRDRLRAELYDAFIRYCDYRDADGWNTAVRLCECLAIVGWGSREPLQAVCAAAFNGNPNTFFVNRFSKPRFLDAVWSRRKGGVAIDYTQSSFRESPDAPSMKASFPAASVGTVQDRRLCSQRNWIAANPICITRGLANCYPGSRAVIDSMENELRPALDSRMRPELYGSALNTIILNCSFSFYDNYHCKTNYIIADESLKLKQKDFYPVLLTMFSEKEIEDNGYYLRNRFTYGPFRADTGIVRVGIVLEKEFSHMPSGRQKQVLARYFSHAVARCAARLCRKITYDFELMQADLSAILSEWAGVHIPVSVGR